MYLYIFRNKLSDESSAFKENAFQKTYLHAFNHYRLIVFFITFNKFITTNIFRIYSIGIIIKFPIFIKIICIIQCNPCTFVIQFCSFGGAKKGKKKKKLFNRKQKAYVTCQSDDTRDKRCMKFTLRKNILDKLGLGQ